MVQRQMKGDFFSLSCCKVLVGSSKKCKVRNKAVFKKLLIFFTLNCFVEHVFLKFGELLILSCLKKQVFFG